MLRGAIGVFDHRSTDIRHTPARRPIRQARRSFAEAQPSAFKGEVRVFLWHCPRAGAVIALYEEPSPYDCGRGGNTKRRRRECAGLLRGHRGGFSVFMKDGKLYWEHNYYNETRYRVSSTAPIPPRRPLLSAEVRSYSPSRNTE